MYSPSSVCRDPNTLSNYHEWRTSHITADLAIEFEQKRCSGKVTLSLKRLEKASRKIVLDTSYLDIEDIHLAGQQVKWNLSQRSDPYGSPLIVEVPEAHSGDAELEIHLKTTKECTAVQWLTPDQTSNKKHPYMFSQCQAIHARSLLPCQDTPVRPDVNRQRPFEKPCAECGLLLGCEIYLHIQHSISSARTRKWSSYR